MRSPSHVLGKAGRQQGLGLVELMIGLMIGLVIMGAVIYVFFGSRLSYRLNEDLARLQESGRIATEMVAQDLRMTGFIGCRRLQSYLPAASTGSISARSIYFAQAFTDEVAAQLGIDAGTLDFEDTHGFVFEPSALPAQRDDTESLVVLAGRNEIRLSEEMSSTSDDLETAVEVPVGPAIVSDCQFDSGLILSEAPPTAIPAPAEAIMVSTAGTSISHPDFTRTYSKDASITPINVVSYSIRDTVRNDNSGASIPALFRNDNELIEGARNLCVLYGVSDGSNEATERFVKADAIDDWRRVIAVRIELLLASVDDNSIEEAQAGFTFCAADFSPPDRRLYKVFSTTVGLRNQITAP